MDSLTQKRCTKCGEMKDFSDFDRDKRKKSGIGAWCKKCGYDNLKKWRSENREKARAQVKKWAKENYEYILEKAKRWAKANPEKVKVGQRRYYENHKEQANAATRKSAAKYPEKQREKTRRFRAANSDKVLVWTNNRRTRLTCNGEKVDVAEWIALKEKYGNRCLCCRRSDVKLTMDHVIPVSLGGRNLIENIQPLCGSCNSKKHNKTIDYRPDYVV